MTNNQITSLWSSHRTKLHDSSIFNEDATINYIPTAAGGMGSESLNLFFKNNKKSVFDYLEQEPITLSITAGNDLLIEEAVIKFCHRELMEWLLPSMEPTHRILEVPFVFSVSYFNQKIASLRVYWDQGTVLKQLGIFQDLSNSKLATLRNNLNNLPLLDAYSAHRAIDSAVPANPLVQVELASQERTPAKPSSMAEIMSGKGVEPTKPSTKVNSAFIGGKSHDIFGQDPEPIAPRVSSPNRRESNIFKEEEPRPSTKVNSHQVGGAAHGIFDPPEEVKANPNYQVPNLFRNVDAPVKPSTRVDSAYVGGKSHDIFTPDLNPVKPAIAPDEKRYESHFKSMGVAEVDHEEKFGRKMMPGNNSSHFSLSEGPKVEEKAPSTKKHFENENLQTHFVMKEEVVVEPARPQTANSYHNQSQIQFAGNAEPSEPPKTSKKGNSNESHWNFQDSIPVTVRPSSRVLSIPGGKSSITLG